MPKICILNTSESPNIDTHRIACLEFIEGFTGYGFTTSEVTVLENIKNIDIILLSSHRIDKEYLKLINQMNPDAIYILWCYYENLDSIPFSRYILTGEYYYSRPLKSDALKIYDYNISINNYVPLLLRTNESPENIGKYSRGTSLTACFMGTPYKFEWSELYNDTKYKILYHDIWKNGAFNSIERKNIYLHSLIAFGFHHQNNIDNSHVTQRVFEGMAYGCIVLSDNKAATDMTNGIVEYVTSIEEVREKIEYYLNNPDKVLEKQLLGYDYTKLFGTNRYSAKLFLDKIVELWNIHY